MDVASPKGAAPSLGLSLRRNLQPPQHPNGVSMAKTAGALERSSIQQVNLTLAKFCYKSILFLSGVWDTRASQRIVHGIQW
jgi:hypothetical protein